MRKKIFYTTNIVVIVLVMTLFSNSFAAIDVTTTEGIEATPQTITVANNGDKLKDYELGYGLLIDIVSCGGDFIPSNWASFYCSLESGQTGIGIIKFKTIGVAPGNYSSFVRIRSRYRWDPYEFESFIPVSITITPPNIFAHPSSISATLLQNVYESQSIAVVNEENTGRLYYEISSDKWWIYPRYGSGFKRYYSQYGLELGQIGIVKVTLYSYFMNPGNYTGNIYIKSRSTTITIPVNLAVKPLCEDKDRDGHFEISDECSQGNDCNDNDDLIYPDAAELCDGKDNDCDGIVDEGCCEVSVRVSPQEVWPQKTSGGTEADVVVKLTKPAPSEGCGVNFSLEPVKYSGGHNHDGNRPKGTISPNDIYFSSGEAGVKSAKYKSSEVSGIEKIKAKLDGSNEAEEFEMKVRVPGLVGLPYGDGHVLIGQTGSHPINHYGTLSALGSLAELAAAHKEAGRGTLRINDMSLEWGGLFDIMANWSPPHKTHRQGNTVDVDDFAVEGKKVTRESLFKTAKESNINVSVLDEGNHLHLTFP
jgi:hypothetical protein